MPDTFDFSPDRRLMASGFDPYYKWLGIPPEEQPPNHYRLLGLRTFETDPEVIEAASDQRMAHLRTHQTGTYSALSQKLLNEVAGAKVCLLSADKRAKYDETLRSRAPEMPSLAPPWPAMPPPRPAMPPPLPPATAAPVPAMPPVRVVQPFAMPPASVVMPAPVVMPVPMVQPVPVMPPVPEAPPVSPGLPGFMAVDLGLGQSDPPPPFVMPGPEAPPAAREQAFDLERLGMSEERGGAAVSSASGIGRRSPAPSRGERRELRDGSPEARQLADRSGRTTLNSPTAAVGQLSTKPKSRRKRWGVLLAGLVGLLCLIAVAIIIAKNYHSADDSANTADGASPADDELQELRKALPELNAAKRLSPLRNTRLDKALWLHMNFEPETIVPHGEMLFVRDLSGKEHHGVCRLGRQIPGRVGNALDCDSPLRLLAGAINQAPQFTVLAWVRIPQSAAGAWWLEENMQGNCLFGAGCGNVLEIRALSKSKLTTGAPVAFADLPVPRDQWNFIALRSAVRNGDTFLMLQVNDQIHKGFNNSDLLPIHAAEAKSRLSFALTAGTQIGELMVFHAALSDADIQALRGNVKPWAVPASLALANAPVLAGAANAPVLAGPANGETLPNPDGITLNWQPMANADRYNVQVLPPWSAKPAVDEKDRHGTSVHVRLRNVMPKADCHGWHWHVRAEVGGQWTDWSETRSFDLAEPPDQGNAPPAEVKRPDQAQPGGRDVADVTERPAPAETPAEVRKPVRAPRQIVKVPMPSDKERAAAVKIVHDEYLKRYTAAGDDVQQRRALAQDMLKRADASADPATQYALMERAMTIAGNCGDLVPALAIADAIGRRFETDAVQLKYDSVMESLKANTIFMPDENQDAGNYVLDVMGQLECAGRYNDAVLLGSRYKERAGVSIKPDMARQITGELRAIGNAKLEKKNVADALEVLKTNPDDAAACAKVGRYRCLFQGDWSGGLPLLAKGNDAALRDMARMEQEGWSDDADALKLAEAWYDLAEKEPAGPSRLALYRRAKHWYTACMEGLSDSDRETAQKRIEQIDHLTEQ